MLPPSLSAPPQKNQPWVGGKGTVRPRGCEQREQEEAWKGWDLRERLPAPRGGGQERFWGAAPAPWAAEGACGFQVWGQVVPAGTDRVSKAPGAPSALHFHLILVPRGFWGAELPARLSRPSTEAGISPLLFPRPGRAEPSGMAQCPQRRRLRRGTRTNRGHLTPNPPRGLCWLPPAAELSGAFPDE